MTGRLRVALVHPFSWPDVRRGGERYLHDLAWHLSRAGHAVDVVTGTSGRAGTTTEGGVVVRRYRHRSAPRVTAEDAFSVTVAAALARRRYDVVHALTPAAAIAASATGHRVVYTVLGHPDAAYLRAHRIESGVFRAALRAASVTTVLSRSAADAIAEVTSRPVTVLPPGVRADAFVPDLRPRTGRAVVLFPSDLSERRKGLDVTLRAVATLAARRADVRLVLAGQGSHEWALREPDVDAAAIAPRLDVVGVGALDELPARYRAASVTVLPSGWEAFGLVLVESLASGTPVVSSDTGGMREIVTDDGVGRRFPHGDHVAMAKAIDEVLALASEPSTPERCVAHARRWDWTTEIGPAHEALYRSL